MQLHSFNRIQKQYQAGNSFMNKNNQRRQRITTEYDFRIKNGGLDGDTWKEIVLRKTGDW